MPPRLSRISSAGASGRRRTAVAAMISHGAAGNTSGFPVMIAAMNSLPLAASDSGPVPAAAAARFFRVLGDPTRLRILELLLAGPRAVSELTAAAGAPRARVSNHLACLRWCG